MTPRFIPTIHRRWRRHSTATCPILLRFNIEALHAADCFEAIVSAEDVHRGKPDPEVFLVAAAKLNVPPSHCIVVEDAVHGIEAARAAGMKSMGVTRNGKPLPADLAMHSLAELAPDAFDNLLLY